LENPSYTFQSLYEHKKSRIPISLYPSIFFKVVDSLKIDSIRSWNIFLSVIKKKRPEGLLYLTIPSIVVVFINSRRNEIEIILFPAGIAESFFPVWEIDNPIGFVVFLIAFWANRRKFSKHDFRVTDVRCMAHKASSGVKDETSAGT